jgi:hypothetical protein
VSARGGHLRGECGLWPLLSGVCDAQAPAKMLLPSKSDTLKILEAERAKRPAGPIDPIQDKKVRTACRALAHYSSL